MKLVECTIGPVAVNYVPVTANSATAADLLSFVVSGTIICSAHFTGLVRIWCSVAPTNVVNVVNHLPSQPMGVVPNVAIPWTVACCAPCPRANGEAVLLTVRLRDMAGNEVANPKSGITVTQQPIPFTDPCK